MQDIIMIRKLRALPNDLQSHIVQYLKNDIQLKRVYERNCELVNETYDLEDKIENLEATLDFMEVEQRNVNERLREAQSLIMDLLLENRRMRSELNTDRDVRRRLDFEQIVLSSDSEE